MKSIASGLSVLAVCGAVVTTLTPFAQAQATKPTASPAPVAKSAKTTKPKAKKPASTTGKMAHKTTKSTGKTAPKPAATPKAK